MDQENHPGTFYTTAETEPKWVQDQGEDPFLSDLSDEEIWLKWLF